MSPRGRAGTALAKGDHPQGSEPSTRYRFNSGFGRFSFRVRLRPNDSSPYSRAASRKVRVHVG
jgi:hypothetical protein